MKSSPKTTASKDVKKRQSAKAAEQDSILEELPLFLAKVNLTYLRAMTRYMAPGKEEIKMHPGMASVYFALGEKDNCIIQDLVDRLSIPNGTLTGILQAMERSQLITRERCSKDGRAARIRLTDRGRKLMPEMKQRHEAVRKVLEKNLKASEVADLKRLLGKVFHTMELEGSER